MSFGRNPHVAKAQVEEQKAADATDDHSRSRAYLEAARQWDRAAEREKPGKQRTQYEDNAIKARELAEGRGEDDSSVEAPSTLRSQEPPADIKSLN